MYLRHELGKNGENIATEYLKSVGYSIVERNYIARQGEIDIVAKDKNELVFIEVKTRSSSQYGRPADAVNFIKQKHLISTIKYYLYSKHLENTYVRIDIIEVYLSKNKYTVNHIKQAI